MNLDVIGMAFPEELITRSSIKVMRVSQTNQNSYKHDKNMEIALRKRIKNCCLTTRPKCKCILARSIVGYEEILQQK